MPDQQPRRRIADHDRRRWSDERLDDLKEDIEDIKDELRAVAALYRKLAPVPELLEQYMKTTDSRLDRQHTALEKIRDENRIAHKNIAYGKDPEDEKKPLPPQPATLTWGSVAKILVIMGTFFGCAATIVAALVTAHG